MINVDEIREHLSSRSMSALPRHPAVGGGLHAVGEPLLTHHGLKVKVQRVPVHQRVMEHRLHVELEPLDGHVVQVTGQFLRVRGGRRAGAPVPVGVEGAEGPGDAAPAVVEAVGQVHGGLQ